MNQTAIQTVQTDVLPSRAPVGQRVAESARPIIKDALTDLVLNNFKDGKVTYVNAAQKVQDGARELVNFLRAAVRCNTVVENVQDWAGWRGLADLDWQNRQTLLPTLVVPEADPSLSDMAYDSFSLRLTVQGGQLENLLAQTAVAISNYLGELVDHGMMGFLDYHEGEAAAYSFIRRLIKVKKERVEDIDKGLGFWVGHRSENPENFRTIYAFRQTRWGQAEYSTEEKVHSLHKARVQPFTTYHESVPIWLKPLKQVMPHWLSPHVKVMTGTIVEESVSYQEVETNEWTLPEVKKVQRASPAILLGGAVLAGWSDVDLGIHFDDRQDFEEFISPSVNASPHTQYQRTGQAEDVSPWPLLIGAAMLFMPWTWPVRIGMAIAGTITALAVTSKGEK